MTSELLHCTVEVFLTECTPFKLDDEHVQRGLEHLQKLRLLSDKNHWRDFGTLPSRMANAEDQVLNRLKKIADALGETPRSEIPGAGFCVDACLHPRGFSFDVLADASVILEFKKYKQPKVVRQNHRQVVSAANFIMNNDPRRMWMYAISIEDELMSVWYFSRSYSVKSKGFNFIQSPETLVKVFLLLLFAQEDEIGIDPTVHRIIDKDNMIHYIYEIYPEDVAEMSSETSGANETEGQNTEPTEPKEKKKRCFKTMGVIYNPRYVGVSRRITRVWRAVEVSGKTADARVIGVAEVALKDVWIDSGSRSELYIQELIHKQLKALRPEVYAWAHKPLQDEIRHLLSHFPKNLPMMQIECGGWGKATKSPPTDAKVDPKILFPDETSSVSAKSSSSTNPKSIQQNRMSTSSSIFSDGGEAPIVDPNRKIAVRRQYRLVYTQVGRSLYEAEDLPSSFTAIKDTFIALVLLFLAGWVHCDISAGNIILVKDAHGRVSGRLSDFEYARESEQVGQSVSMNAKTGTPYFLPIEIHSGMTLLNPRQPQTAYGAVYQRTKKRKRGCSPSEDRQAFFKGTLKEKVKKLLDAAIHPELQKDVLSANQEPLHFTSLINNIRVELWNSYLPVGPQDQTNFYDIYNIIYLGLSDLQELAMKAEGIQFKPQTPEPLATVPPLNERCPDEEINNEDDDTPDKSEAKKGKAKADNNQIQHSGMETRAAKKAKRS
ncbi:hypothetical protein NP233_g914 [Leucocoprinus birnbaumii]|uniref:Fungal-type protein kinase domain-containing protein n=1 Tax=Leucocoprinus birnbaumii TaxID=56174 RepID=A0AAD5W0Z9_9AGAR|nr:hypothetical protein NP233_g914 [Leucocoprinus birnbaumii]